MHVHVRQKRYREHVRAMVLDGKVNFAETGAWGTPPASLSNGAYKNSLDGARGKDRRHK